MKLIECFKIEILYIDVDYVKFHLMILSRQLLSYIALICKQNDNKKKFNILNFFFFSYSCILLLLSLVRIDTGENKTTSHKISFSFIFLSLTFTHSSFRLRI